MPDSEPRFDSAFRLNLEQQHKRAKELLRDARAGDLQAQARIDAARGPRSADIRLADAQRAIARELGLRDWMLLRRHIGTLDHARAAIAATRAGDAAPDTEERTLHLRCGSDILAALRAAGFRGDFLEHAWPYAQGIATGGAEALDRAAAGHERVVIWSEHDVHDQLVLLRLLDHYARHARPRHLELIEIAAFPGRRRFVGLGQLPPEALRMLWETRRAVTPAQLALASKGWQALTSPNPRALARLAIEPRLPLRRLAAALRRHLQELPAPRSGLSHTQRLLLARLSIGETAQARLIGAVMQSDELPGQTDLHIASLLAALETGLRPLVVREPRPATPQRQPPWTDLLRITAAGIAALHDDLDWMSLSPPDRYVGGVPLGSNHPDWRWDERTRKVTVPREISPRRP